MNPHRRRSITSVVSATSFVSALALLTSAAACGGGDDADAPVFDGAMAFAVSTDYVSTGVASAVSVGDLALYPNVIEGVASTDPTVRQQADRLYVINRFGSDNITVLGVDPLELIAQISTGTGSNPQDVFELDGRIYVATMGGDGVAMVDPEDPAGPVDDPFDLSSLDEEDGIPNCSTLTISGDYLIVGCAILDDDDQFLTPRGVGKVAVLNLETGDVIDIVDMTHTNPFGFGLSVPSKSPLAVDMLIATNPSFADPAADGCVQQVVVDPATGDAEVSCWLDNATLGGFVSSFDYDLVGDTIWMSVVSGFDPDDFGAIGVARSFDTDSDTLGEPVTGDDVRVTDVAVCGNGRLVMSDVGKGLRIFDLADVSEVTSMPLDIGLPPIANGVVCN